MSERKRNPRPPYPPEVRERAVRMVFDHQGEYPSQWKAIESIAAKLSINHETLRIWAPMERQYVGIDLHRRSTTIYRMAGDGEVLGCVRIPSQPFELAQAMEPAGLEPEVVLESTYG
jgi:transposase-like protein